MSHLTNEVNILLGPLDIKPAGSGAAGLLLMAGEASAAGAAPQPAGIAAS